MDNLKHSEPSYVYKDSGWVTMLIASLIGIGGLIYVFEGMYEDGIDNVLSGTILEIFIGFAALIGWFFMIGLPQYSRHEAASF